MRDNTHPETERGQAYTLEGFISAMIVLMAVLFAMQSVVIAPTTGGLADRTVQAQIEQETQDALVAGATADGSEGNGDLSKLVRYWDNDSEEFYNSETDNPNAYYDPSNDTEFANNFTLGTILSERFDERGLSYDVELVYQNESGEFGPESSTYLVSQGKSEAVTASYTVTLYENQTLTAPGNERTLDEADSYPIPRATEDDSSVYNVVEVRVTVW